MGWSPYGNNYHPASSRPDLNLFSRLTPKVKLFFEVTMNKNLSPLSSPNSLFNDCGWRSFNLLNVSANTIGAGVCIFYFYHFGPAGRIHERYDAFIIPVIVTIFLVMIGMGLQYRRLESLKDYIRLLDLEQLVPLDLQIKAKRRILNLPYISAWITLQMWGIAALFMAIYRLMRHPAGQAWRDAITNSLQVFGGTFIAGLVTSVIILFTMETHCRKIRPYFFPDGNVVKTPDAYQLILRARLLITFFLTSVLPFGLLGLLTYNKVRMMAYTDPQTVLVSMSNLTIFLVVISIYASMVLSRHSALCILNPIRDLEKAMTRVENGDLTASVLVRSNDELGAMAENFNKMVGALRERSRMQQSLNMAMEVQQNLLPKALPRIHGIDMASACTYCDETGGDYLDRKSVV